MGVVLVVGALLLMFLGLGSALLMSGYRHGKAVVLWTAVVILVVLLPLAAVSAFFTIACWTGGGCI
jgi:hypothetical protein